MLLAAMGCREAVGAALGGDGSVRVARAMMRWQLVDDSTLGLVADLSSHFPADQNHHLELSYQYRSLRG
jgi:hypothetical protein